MKQIKRIISLVICCAVLAGYIPAPAHAEDLSLQGLCEHHKEHIDCAYAPAVEAVDCNHQHDDACGTEGESCSHVHDGTCGYAEAKDAVKCDYTCSVCSKPEGEPVSLVDGELGSGTPDGTPPVLHEMAFSSTTVNAPCSVEFTIKASDDISGLDFAELLFSCKETGKGIKCGAEARYYDEEQGKWVPYEDGLLHGVLEFDSYVESGTFIVDYIHLTDIAGNYVRYYADMDNPGNNQASMPAEISNMAITVLRSETTDTTPPVLNQILLSQDTVQGPAQIEIIVDATDDVSGVQFAEIILTCMETGYSNKYGASAFYYDNEQKENVTYEDGMLHGTIQISEYMPAGKYVVEHVLLSDNAENVVGYSRTDNPTIPTQVENVVLNILDTGKSDSAHPILNGVTLSTTSVTAPGEIQVTIDAFDALSGTSHAEINLHCQETKKNIRSFIESGWYDSEQGKWIEYEDGLLHGTLEIDQYVETGDFVISNIWLCDKEGNRCCYAWDADESTMLMPEAVKALTVHVFNTTPDVTTSVSKSEFVDAVKNATDNAYIAADYSGDATMPKEAFDAIAGTEKTIDLISAGITWRFEGSDITEETKNIDLNVEIQKVEDDASASGDAIEGKLNGNPGVVMKFPENGTLPGKATIQVKVDYAMREYLGSGEGLSVYYYNNQTGELELIKSNLNVINDTYVEFPITHCSYYVLTNPNGSNSGTTHNGVAVDKTNFPDDNFRAWILEQDYGKDGLLTTEELANVTWIEVPEKNIKDLTGVEHFTALQHLYCYDNQLTSLDVSRNTVLAHLSCAGNQMTSLNVGNSTTLTELNCHVNQLTSLDITGCTALKQLNCDSNLLTLLDVSKNTALTWLNCGNNQLTDLDLRGNKELAELNCYNNQLASLDVSNCTALTFLDCNNNQLTSLDTSKNTALTSLFCYNNQLKELDMSGNTALKMLHCYDNQLTKLIIRNNAALEGLGCDGNQLTELDVSQNIELKDLACGINQIESLNVRNCIKLEYLECDDNKITELDLTQNPMLKALSCDSNLLTVLDLSKNTKLEQLQCCANQLAGLDLSNNPACTDVMAHSNRRTITVNGNNEFDLNSLQGFDVSKASKWTGGIVSDGILTALNRTITYTYQINSNETVMFTLQVNNYNPNAVKMEDQWGDLHWKIDRGGNLTISGTGEMLHYSDPNGAPDSSNPAVDGYPWHKYQDIIETVVVEDGVTTLAELAFHGLKNLYSVELPSSLTTIGDAAFAFCPVLESVEIPAKVSSIGKEVFYESASLKKVTFTGNAPVFDSAAFGKVTLDAYYPVENKTWTADVRKDYEGHITWIGTVTTGICGEDLIWSYNAGTLTISGTGAMYDYSKDQTKPAPWNHLAGDITKLVIEEGVTEIGDFAFMQCAAIENASFPSTLTRVGEYAFYRFSRPNGNVYHRPFYSEINQTVRQWSQIQFEADNEGFPGWDTTTFVHHAPIIASGIFGDKVFWELNEDGTMEIFGTGDMYEFGATGSPCGEMSVKTVTIGEGITNIGANIFEGWGTVPLTQTFESITVASTVKRVEDMAFTDCKALKSITFTGDAPSFGENCFRGVTATAYYPVGNATWTNAVMQDYEGTITWEAYCSGHVFGDWVIEGNTSSRTCTLCGYTEHKVTTDSGDVEIEIPEQPDLEVEVDPVLPSENDYVLVEEAFENVDNQDQVVLKVFDINLKNADGVHVQPNGTVKVKLPLDWEKDGNYKVYRVNDDGTLTDMNAYRQGSHMVFETDHFSLYVIVEEGHRHNYQAVVTAPTCTADGFTTYTCDGCGNSYVDNEIASLGHSYDKGKVTTKPTCMAEGVKTYTCGTCGDTKTEPVEKDPKNHSFTKYESDKNATCKKNGTKTAKCDHGCGKTHTITDKGSKLGHRYKDDKCIRCGHNRWNPDTGDKITIAFAGLIVSGIAILLLVVRRKRKS